MSEVTTKSINGDVTIGRHVTAGGDATVRGRLSVGHNLQVKGWLDAPNIKGPNKGLFKSEASLREAYERPEAGWYAIVGNDLSGDIWVAERNERGEVSWEASGGKWSNPGTDASEVAADATGALRTELVQLQQAVEAHLETWEQVKANLQNNYYPKTDANANTIVEIETELNALRETLNGHITTWEAAEAYLRETAYPEIAANRAAIAELRGTLEALPETLTARVGALEAAEAELREQIYPGLESKVAALESYKAGLPQKAEQVSRVLLFDGIVQTEAGAKARPKGGIYYVKDLRTWLVGGTGDEAGIDYVDDYHQARETQLYRLRESGDLYRYCDPEGLLRYMDEDDVRTQVEAGVKAAVERMFEQEWTGYADCVIDAEADAAERYVCNGLGMSRAEAMAVLRESRYDRRGADMSYMHTRSKSRTFIKQYNYCGGDYMDLTGAYRSAVAEVVVFDTESPYIRASKLSSAFRDCTHLREIKGLYTAPGCVMTDAFRNCVALETLEMSLSHGRPQSFSLADSPKIKIETLEYIVESAAAATEATTPITIGVHPEVYEKLGIQQRWIDVAEAAAAKLITFVQLE